MVFVTFDHVNSTREKGPFPERITGHSMPEKVRLDVAFIDNIKAKSIAKVVP